MVANPTYRSTAFTRAFDRQEGLTTVPNWLYLTGSLSQLGEIWRHYGVAVQNLPAGAMSAHNDVAVIIDPAGHIRQEMDADPGPGTSGTQSSFSVLLSQYARQALRQSSSRRAAGAAALLACAGLACAGLIAGCGSQPAGVTGAGPPPPTAPLSTSLITAQGAWAVAVVGGPDAGNEFWQLFFRPATSGRWSLVTPQGVADNGGMVAAGGDAYLVVGFRPSQNLTFSPLATSTDTGRNWTPGLLDARLADTPGAIAVGPSGRTLALLQDGTIEAATAGSSAAGRWARLTTLKALGASAPGRACGLEGVTAVSFGPDGYPMAAGSCARPGPAGVFTDAGGTWRSAGLALPPGARCGCSA